MRVLYFDINGTLTEGATDRAKQDLGAGKFEDAVREAGFHKLVCVSSMVGVIEAYQSAGREVDGHRFILQHCGGTIRDLDWFRHLCTLEPKYRQRGSIIDESQDWWYVDDYAKEYLGQAKRRDLQDTNRVLAPDAQGDGQDVLAWLQQVPPLSE